MTSVILYQDKFLPREQGHVDMEDRGYQFGDGIYEAIRVYSGHLFLLESHLKRLVRSAHELKLALPYGPEELTAKLRKLISLNGIDDGMVYFQITRGAAPRQHQFPDGIAPVLTGSVSVMERDPIRTRGITAILSEDIRWLRCDIKTLNLLGNVLARQAASEAGAQEAIFHRGDTVTEGTSCNVFIVRNGQLITHQPNQYILNGITRLFVLDLAKKLSIPFIERDFSVNELRSADEVFITSTGREVTAVTRIADRIIGSGEAGPVTNRLIETFSREVERIKASE